MMIRRSNTNNVQTRLRQIFEIEDTTRIIFSDEKFFDTDSVYNSQNDRMWSVDCADADQKCGITQGRKFPWKVMVWLGACSKGITPLVIFDEGIVNHTVYV